MPRSDVQHLIDIMFEIGLAIQRRRDWFDGKSNEEVCTWIAEKLRNCGYDTTPMGCSWGVLRREL